MDVYATLNRYTYAFMTYMHLDYRLPRSFNCPPHVSLRPTIPILQYLPAFTYQFRSFTGHNRLDPAQRSWVLEELKHHPIQADQPPELWLLWRQKVAEGYDENTAWQLVMHAIHNIEGGAQQETVQQEWMMQPHAGPSNYASHVNMGSVNGVTAQPSPLNNGYYQQCKCLWS